MQRDKTRRSKRRRCVQGPTSRRHRLEALERRLVLSGAHEQELLNAFAAGLAPSTKNASALSGWTENLTAPSILGQSLPQISNELIGNGAVPLYSPSAELDKLLAQYSGPSSTVSQLQASLGGIAGITVSAARDLPDDIELDTVFQATTNLVVPLADAFGPVNLTYGGDLGLSVGLKFQMTLGAFWDATAGAAEFYVKAGNNSLQVTPSIASSNLPPSARLGIVDLNVSAASAAMAATFTMSLSDPGTGANADGRITLSELENNPSSSVVSTSIQTVTPASLSLTFTSSLVPASDTLSVTWPSMADPNTVQTNLASLGAYSLLNGVSAGDVATGLAGLTNWANATNSLTLLGNPLPVVGNQVSQLADLATTLNNQLVRNVGAYTSAETIVSQLAGVAGNKNVQAQLVGDNLQFQVQFDVSSSQPVELQPLLDAQLKLAFGSPDIVATSHFTGTLTFGVDLDKKVFYVGDGAATTLLFDLGVNAVSINDSASVGFVSVNVVNGSAQLAAHLGLALEDPAHSGRITTADMAAGAAAIGSYASVATTGNATLSLPLSVPLLGGPTKTLTAQWNDLSALTSVSTNAADFENLNTYQKVSPLTISDGLDQFAMIMVEASEDPLTGVNPLETPLPIVNQSLAQIIGFKQFFASALTQYTDSQTNKDGSLALRFANSSELSSLLAKIPNVDTTSLTASADANDIRFRVAINSTLDQTFPIAVSLAPAMDLSVTGNVAVKLTTRIDVTFGVRVDTGLFFIAQTPGPQFSLTGTMSADLSEAARLGFLAVNIAHGTTTLSASAAVLMTDPNTDGTGVVDPSVGFPPPASPGEITFTEMEDPNLTQLVSVSESGSAGLSLPISNSLFAESGTLGVTWTDITQPTQFTLDTSRIPETAGFNNVSVPTVTAGLDELPAVLAHLTDPSTFSKPLPLVGSNVGSLVAIASQATADVNSLGAFATAQDLQAALDSQLGAANVQVSASASDLQFLIHLHQDIVNESLPASVRQTIGGLGFQTGFELAANGAVDVNLRFGLKLVSGVAANDRFYIVAGSDSNATLSLGATANSIAPTASFGLASASVTGGTGLVAGLTNGAVDSAKSALLNVAVVDPATGTSDNAKVTLTQLLAAPGAVLGPLVASGGLHVALPLAALPTTPSTDHPLVSLDSTNLLDPTSIAVSTRDLSSYLAAGSNFDPAVAQRGMAAIADLLNDLSTNSLLNTKVPFVNKTALQLVDFMTPANNLVSEIKNDAAGTGGPGFDQEVRAAIARSHVDATQFTITPNPNGDATQYNPAQGKFLYLLDYHADLHPASQAFDFGSTLFTLQTSLAPDIKVHMRIEFGLNPQSGFFVEDLGQSAGAELQVTAGINANFDKVTGQFGPLVYGVHNGTLNVTLNASLDLIAPSGAGGPIAASDLAHSLPSVVSPGLSGTAQLVLPIGFHLGIGGPGITTTFSTNWNAAQPEAFTFGPNGSTDPANGFGPVNFELGDVISGMIGPWLSQVQKYDPIPPEVADFLEAKLPVFNVSILDALVKSGIIPPGVKFLFDVAKVVKKLPTGGSVLDLSSYLNEPAPSNPGAGSPSGGNVPGSLTSFIQSVESDDGVKLPFLDDVAGSIVKILLGQDIDLVVLPKIEFKRTLTIAQGIVPVASSGAVEVTFKYNVHADVYADLQLGLSTRGLTHPSIDDGSKSLLNGLYIVSNLTATDTSAFQFGADIEASGSLDATAAGLVGVYGQINLTGTIGAYLADVKPNPNSPITTFQGVPSSRVGIGESGGDGRVNLDELEWLAHHYDVQCVVTPGGEIDLGGEAGISVGAGAVHIPVIGPYSVALTHFDLVNCKDPSPAHLADVVGNSLVMVPDPNPDGSRISVTIRRDPLGNPQAIQILKVVAKGASMYQDFPLDNPADPNYAGNVTRLSLQGTAGDDQIRVTPEVMTAVPITYISLDSGDGNDQIDFSGIPATSHLTGTYIKTGNGNDTVIGSFAPDSIVTGNGNDVVLAGAGNDTVVVGSGNDTISGGSGNDSLVGGAGHDLISGDAGNDTIMGGSGDSTLLGGDGNDLIYGGGGNDYIDGGDGNDIIHTGTGKVSADGGEGNDFIYGDGGNDTLHGGSGENVFFTGPGDEEIFGDNGNNLVLQTASGRQTLTDTTLKGLGNDSLSNIQRVVLTGGTGDNIFDVSGYSGVASLVGGTGGHNTVVSTNDTNFTLSDWNLTRSDGASFSLSGIDSAILAGGGGDNTFDVTNWTGLATLDGGGGLNTLISTNNANFTLSDAAFSRSTGGTFNLANIQKAILTADGGSHLIDASNFSGLAVLYGAGANDTLFAGSGGSYLSGGAGSDSLVGGSGNDVLIGGAGAHDTLRAGSGTEVLIAPTGGGSLLFGGAGLDRLYGQGPANTLFAGPGDAVLDAGSGGGNTLRGGAGHDVLIGHSGSDVLTAYTGTTTTPNLLYPNNGPAAAPPVYNPPVAPKPGLTLPQATDTAGRWAELDSSATGAGLSGLTGGEAIEPSIVAGVNGEFVAWSDRRSGSFQIYVARHTAAGWKDLHGSAEAGGVSAAPTGARRPSIALNSAGWPVVAWSQDGDIHVAQYDPTFNGGQGGWLALGNSLSAGGISGSGLADVARVVNTQQGPVVAWTDRSSGAANVFVRQFNGVAWNALGAGAASGSGVSGSATDVSGLSLATDRTRLAVAWTQSVTGGTRVYLRQFDGNTWNELAGSATGDGIGPAGITSQSPTLAYAGASLFAAWLDNGAGHPEVNAAEFNGASWVALGSGSGEISNSGGAALAPRLAASGNSLYLFWANNLLLTFNGNKTALYAKKWDGAAFIEELPGDASLDGISDTGGQVTEIAAAVGTSGNPLIAWGDLASGSPQIYVRGNTFTVHTIYYVQDGGPRNVYTTRPAVSSDTGLTPDSPLLSVGAVFAKYTLHPGDVVLVDPGVYHHPVTLSAAANGVLIEGVPSALSDFAAPFTVDQASGVLLQRLNLDGGALIEQATGAALVGNTIGGDGAKIYGGSGVQMVHNVIASHGAGVLLGGGTSAPIVDDNSVLAQFDGIAVIASASQIEIRGNRISAQNVALSLPVSASGIIAGNDLAGGGTGLSIAAPFTGEIANNSIHDSGTGVSYAAAAALDDNRIYFNGVGIVSSVEGTTAGLGFVGNLQPNQIFDNGTGVQLSGQMQNQHVYGNTTGVAGQGVLGPTADMSLANFIEANGTGVQFAGPIEFNRIARNGVGVVAAGSQLIAHNQFYANVQIGIQIQGQTDERIFDNTFYSLTGDNIDLAGGASNVQILNNVLWSGGGYDINVANDSQSGFFSDYNDLYSTGAGKLVFWEIGFSDVLDWQQDIDLYDLHSIGTTVVNPLWAAPRFYSIALNDFRVLDLAAGERFTSPTIDAGDPLADQALPASQQNLLTNPGFESGLAGWTANPSGGTQAASPISWEGSQYFTGGTNPDTVVSQTVDLVAAGFTAADLDSQNLVAVFGGRIRSAAETPPDTGALTLTFLDAAGNAISHQRVAAHNVADRWELVGGRLTVPVGTRSVTYAFEAVRKSGPTSDSFLDGAFLYLLPSSFAPDQGAFGSTSAENQQSTATHIALWFPDLYTDWEKNKPHDILWNTYNNTTHSLVRIDLYQDGLNGPQFLANITSGTPDNGNFAWTPANSGIDFGTHGLRIQISLVGNPGIFDRSTETFAVPENTNTFFVNDAVVNAGDLTTAPGSVRNTGKLASSPKPYPFNVLNIYSLGANQTLTIDAGDYAMLQPLVVSNISGVGDDEGFTFTGPSDLSRTATLHMANPLTHVPIVELSGADFMTVENLTMSQGQVGVLVDQSSHFTGSHLTVENNAQDGLLLTPSAAAASLDHITSFSNGGNGITAGGGLVGLTDSSLFGNVANGVSVTDAGTIPIEANTIYGNGGYGILVTNNVPATTTVVGNADLTKGRGNKISGNFLSGIYAAGGVLVAGNTVSGQTNTNQAGIVLGGGAQASDNVVYGNDNGIVATSAPLTGNRVYHNAHIGILANGGDNLSQNIVYSNAAGIQSYNPGNSITNNLVYANAALGVGIHGSKAPVVSNTIYQPQGDAIDIDGGATSVSVRNNILWTQSGYDLSVSTDSQSGFASDFNDLYASGAGNIGFWQGAARATFTAWQDAAFVDLDSLSHDPLFVNAAGADGAVGYVDSVHDGSDDDFHVQSVVGSFHGGALAPVVSAATGLPVFAPATLTADAAQSPAIDRGGDGDSFANEPTPNGGYVNLGAYGNTPQASESPTSYVLVMNPSGGETWPEKSKFDIRWRSQDKLGTVRIDLLEGANPTPVLTIGTGIANTGSYTWTLPTTLTPAADYVMRITREDAGAASGASLSPFTIAPPVTVYYVNDGTVNPGDWTTAPGNDANDGLTPATPKADIQAVLIAYHPGYGDTIRVDAGTYNLTTNIPIPPADSGVTVVGYNDPAHLSAHAVLDRGVQNDGSYVFELTGGNDVTLDHLAITDAAIGVQANDTGSKRLTVSNCDIYGNRVGGINLFGYSVTNAVITGNRVHDNNPNYAGGFGIDASYGGGHTITNNVVFDHYQDGISASIGTYASADTISGNTTFANNDGISAGGAGTIASGNTAYDNRGYGIGVGAGAVAANNTTYGQTAFAVSEGIELFGGEARDNTVFDNYNGITGGGLYDGNRVFHNSHAGIVAIGGSTVTGNQVYSNDHGIEADSSYNGPYVSNNLVYANTTYGIGVHGAESPVTNNTVYQPSGDALIVDSASANVHVENNILWAVAGHDLTVAPDSEIGFQSDYNDLVTAGGNLLGQWEGRDFTNRVDWLYELGFDQHSITADPQFVRPAGADGILGFSSAADASSAAQIVDDTSKSGFATTGTWTSITGGYNGEALQSSGAPTDTATYTFNVTPGWYEVAATWPATSGDDITNYTVLDGPAIGTVTVDQTKIPSDFTSSGASWKNLGDFYIGGGTLIVQINSGYRQVVADAVLVQKLQGDHGADDDFHVAGARLAGEGGLLPGSATIDAGDPNSAYNNEPAPNGGRINLGFDGDTASATPSPIQFVQEVAPAGLEKFQLGQTVPIRWRSAGLSGAGDTINIDLLRDGDPTFRQRLADHIADNGEFDWTIPTSQLQADDYRIRIEANAGIQPQAVTPEPFVIANNGHDYYVNDGSTAGDVFTTAVGNDANSGKSPDQPVASLAALLTAYHFGPGDIIHVDTGTYNLLTNVRLPAQDSGVTIVGSPTAAAVFNRGNSNSGANVFELDGATDVTLDHLSITGGLVGIEDFDTGSKRLTVTNCDVYGNSYYGIQIYGYSITDVHITNNVVHDNGGYSGISVGSGAGMIVSGNTVYNNHGDGITVLPGGYIPGYTVSGNTVYGNNKGITAGGSGTVLQNNTIYNNTASGVEIGSGALALDNTIYGQVADGPASQGIYLFGGEARGNAVYGNYNGIDGVGLADGNRVYQNLNAGIVTSGSGVVTGNFVYANDQGIQAYNASNVAARGPYLTNNAVYGNTTLGVGLHGGADAQFTNNTVYQPTGNALVIDGPSINDRVENNILWAQAGYDISVSSDNTELNLQSDYNDLYTTAAGVLGQWDGAGFATRSAWFYQVGQDRHSIAVNPQFLNAAAGDFHLGTSSPAIDAGDPATSFENEPSPNGGRVNLGNYGDTADATPTSLPAVQVVAPVGLDKYQVGQTVPITWRTVGVNAPTGYYSNEVEADKPLAYYRLGETSGTTAHDASGSGLDGSYVNNPTLGADGALMQDPDSSAQFPGGTWDSAAGYVQLPSGFANLQNGLTLEVWAYPTAVRKGEALFGLSNGYASDNVVLSRDGTTNDLIFQVYTGGVPGAIVRAAGAIQLNAWQHFVVTEDGAGNVTIYKNGQAIAIGVTSSPLNVTRTANYLGKSNFFHDFFAGRLDEAAVYNYALPAARIQDHYNHSVYGTVNIDLDVGGVGVMSIATQAPDSGSFAWTIPAAVLGGGYQVRVHVNDGGQPDGLSHDTFLVANNGHDYYVNDASTAGDVFTTAPGDDGNSGKAPDAPMATLRAMLLAYNFQPGDVIHVDTGNYRLYRNVVLPPQDSGVTIEGPSTAEALLNRGNQNINNDVIDLAGATHVTLDHLSISGGVNGVFASSTTNSSYLTISNDDIKNNSAYAVYIDASNDHAVVSGNTVRDNTLRGYGQPLDPAVYVAAADSVIDGNQVFGDAAGIQATYTGGEADRIVVSNNVVRDNDTTGISGGSDVLVTGNNVFNNKTGVYLYNESGRNAGQATQNLVHENQEGFLTDNFSRAYGMTIAANRVYHNSVDGIHIFGSMQAIGNQVYSNPVGILGDVLYGQFAPFSGLIDNNLIYANTNQAVVLNGVNGATVDNNDLYQPVGDALDLTGGARNVRLYNNIVWVNGGYDFNVAPDSQSGLTSDYNLFNKGPAINAHVGYYNGATRDALADWQTASGLDGHSLFADPHWIDINGADNVLGYSTAGNGYDGGADDNFYLAEGSPAIDRGYSWPALANDMTGVGRHDDAGTTNSGSPDYFESKLSSSLFSPGGTAQNFHGGASGNSFMLNLPFAFPFYDGSYTSVTVSSRGFLEFAGSVDGSDGTNSDAKLASSRIVAPFWANLRTDVGADDVFVDSSVANQVTIRWRATSAADGSAVNFDAVLFQDGHIRFDYGAGNANQSPTIGLSFGNGQIFALSAYDGGQQLNGAASTELDLKPGYVDIGAIEFPASSLQTTPPSVTGVSPAAVSAGGNTSDSISSLTVSFSEALNPIDARAPAVYELRKAGANGFGSADDTLYTLAPTYVAGSNAVTLAIPGLPSGKLPLGNYRFTIFSNSAASIHDLAGLELDGDANGTPGGDYIRTFSIVPHAISVTALRMTATEGAPFSGVVAAFTDNDPRDVAGDFTTSIDWGDGFVSTGSVSLGNDGVFTLAASHIYAEEGTYTATATIDVAGLSPTSASALATVTDPSVKATTAPISAVAGTPKTVNVAIFTDPGGAETAADYSATIAWGDGNSSPGTITGPDANGLFTVSGTNTYAAAGTYTASVSIGHAAAAAVTVASSATVTGGGALPAVTSIIVEKGLVERSFIRYLDIVFNESGQALNDLIAGGDLTLIHHPLSGVISANDPTVPLAGLLTAVGDEIEIDFGALGLGGAPKAGSLGSYFAALAAGNGYYELDVVIGGHATREFFYRLLGDVNGDRVVDAADLNAITAALGQTGAGLNADVNGDGSVDILDKQLALLEARSPVHALAKGLWLDD